MSEYRGLDLLQTYEEQQSFEDRFIETDVIIEEYDENYVSRPGFVQESNKTHMKRFLDRNKYDPETGTYETDMVDENGKKIRVPLEISATEPSRMHARVENGKTIPYKITINRKHAKSKNWNSQFILKHEEGHYNDYMKNGNDDDVESVKRNSEKFLNMQKRMGNSSYVHGTPSRELYADKYSVNHTSLRTATKALTRMHQAKLKNMNKIKRFINSFKVQDFQNGKIDTVSRPNNQEARYKFENGIRMMMEYLNTEKELNDKIQRMTNSVKRDMEDYEECKRDGAIDAADDLLHSIEFANKRIEKKRAELEEFKHNFESNANVKLDEVKKYLIDSTIQLEKFDEPKTRIKFLEYMNREEERINRRYRDKSKRVFEFMIDEGLAVDLMYMEASEDDSEETPVEEANTDTTKEDNNASTDEKESDNVGDDEDVDLSEFGQHGGDDLPNNEYDQKEVETLNALIASEASAISEYAEAAKTSKEDILQRLYSDISDEERFHLEQLMFAKAELTGEKYMPTDPAVKKEYEELLELGMDEESAMATAVDKTGLRKQIEESDGDIEADTKQLETEIEMLEAAVFNTELLMTIMEQAEERRDQTLLNQIYAFSESYYQEAVMNSADASDDIRKPFNPFQALFKLLMGIMRGIATLIANFKKWIVSMRQRRSALQQWIQNHGIQGLFDSGVWLYLWNDQTQSFDFNDMAWYIDALYVIAADCARDGFITNGRVIDQDAFNKYAGAFQSSTVPLGVNGQIPNREEALNRIQSLNMIKTKIIVNQQNENVIREMWFGYTDDAMIKFNPENKPVTLRSKNIYNAIQYLLDVSNYYGLRTGDLIKGFQTIGEGSPNRNSIFYTNRNLYNEDYRQLKIVVQGYSRLSKCFTHDLKTIMWVNNGVLERTNAKDAQNNDPAHRYPDPNQTRMFVNNKSQQELDAEKYSRDQWHKNHQTAVQNGNTTPPPPQVTVNK